jgi:hypothetical protein
VKIVFLLDLEGGQAFTAWSPDNCVVPDTKTLAVTGHIDVGGEPDGLARTVR